MRNLSIDHKHGSSSINCARDLSETPQTESRREREGDAERAAAIIRRGGIAAFPTETVYGLGADAFNARSVARVFEVKGRPRFDPLIVHVSCAEEARAIVSEFPQAARELAERFWPGPLTVVLPKNKRVPDIVTAGLGTIGVRVPDHPLALEMIRRTGTGVAAPSANSFGGVSPTTAAHVRESLGGRIDMLLDGGPCRVGVESTIVMFSSGRAVLLRPGGTAIEDIERVTGPLEKPPTDPDGPLSPGRLPRHYAPRTPIFLLEDGHRPSRGIRAGLLSFTAPGDAKGFAAAMALSPGGDLREAAANLFSAMRRLDCLALDAIYAETVPEPGLGAAINDRLRRAARRDAADFRPQESEKGNML